MGVFDDEFPGVTPLSEGPDDKDGVAAADNVIPDPGAGIKEVEVVSNWVGESIIPLLVGVR